MRVVLSWLADFTDLDPASERVASALELLGHKIEAVHRPGEGIEGVVVAEVLAIEEIPEADRLILARVGDGTQEREVLVGARNFSVGDRVPLALPGARLPKLEGEIRRVRKRGRTSDGMLCSAWELGLSEDHSGILVLPPESAVGTDAREALGLGEIVFELEITPNRPDVMSLVGVARELAAATGSDLRLPLARPAEGTTRVSELADVVVEDPSGCPRYLARVVTGVAVGPSPDVVQRRLTAAGLRPVSNVVDATNYALLVTGHPMHAFDLDTLEGNTIVVRRARKGELLTTIDQVDRELDPDDLLICHSAGPVALAGIMGGSHTEVSEKTSRVLLESAYFQPSSILRSSKRHGLRSEASARFERGVDPNAVADAALLACSYILEWAGGDLAAGAIDRYPAPTKPIRVTLRPDRANALLGTDWETGEMHSGLLRLGIDASLSDGRIVAEVPTRRQDIRAEEDLIEEVARVIGYDRIPTTLPMGRNRAGALTREQRLERHLRRVLAGAGLFEAYCTSLIGPADLDRLGYSENHPARSALQVTNALSVEESILRTTLLPGLLASAARNVARRSLAVRLFEIGRTYLPSGGVLPDEPLRLGVILHGPTGGEWYTPEREMDFFDLKGVIDVLLEDLRVEGRLEPVAEEAFHPTRTAALMVGEERIGVLGELSQTVTDRYDLTHRTLFAEVDLLPLIERAHPPVQVPEMQRFPAVLRDLAVVVGEGVGWDELAASVWAAGGALLEEVRLFDIYRGQQIESGHRGLAMRLAFRHPGRTLTDEEANRARDAIARALSESYGAKVRE